MNKYVKAYLFRGLIFGGFGPIIAGIVFWSIQLSGGGVSLGGGQMLIAIVSTYLLAFMQAGASVFNQIESWSVGKSTGIHFICLYIAYIVCYLINRWLPWRWEIIALFTGIFIVAYFAVWLTVYLIVRKTGRKLNDAVQKTE